MKKLIIAFAALAAAFLTGCTATKVEYSRNNEGEVKYKIEHNGHWLKTEAESMGGGMSQDGQFNIELAGLKSSPSEEFNKVMKTYTSAVVTLAQIAAAAYNPSASTASQSVNAGQGASTAITVNTAQTDAAKAATANATQAETAQTNSYAQAAQPLSDNDSIALSRTTINLIKCRQLLKRMEAQATTNIVTVVTGPAEAK